MQIHGSFGPVVLTCAVIASLVSIHGQAGAQVKGDEQRIRDIIQNEATAWARGDAVAYSQDFADDGVFTNVLGQFFTGHGAFLKQHEYIFKGPYRGTTAHFDVVSLKFLRPDVAVVHVLSSVTGFETLAEGLSPDHKGRLRTRLMQVLVKLNGEWKIVDYHNVDVKAQTPVPEPNAH